jgi:hypothetical protein
MLYSVIGGFDSGNEDFKSLTIFKDEDSAIEYSYFLEYEDGYDYALVEPHEIKTIKNLHKERTSHRIVTVK